MRQKKALAVLAFGVVLLTGSCTSTDYNTQKVLRSARQSALWQAR